MAADVQGQRTEGGGQWSEVKGRNQSQLRARAVNKMNQAGLADRPDWQGRWGNADRFNRYANWRLRSIRSVLAPKGRSSSAPAIIVVGSGIALKETLSRPT
jgi:hypothetical protein